MPSKPKFTEEIVQAALEGISRTDKYDALWAYIRENGKPQLTLTFEELERIAGVPLNHAFLQYKKELLQYGYAVEKISMKAQTVLFIRKEA